MRLDLHLLLLVLDRYNWNHVHGHVPLVFMLLWMQQITVLLRCRRGRLRQPTDRSLLEHHRLLLRCDCLHHQRLRLHLGRQRPLRFRWGMLCAGFLLRHRLRDCLLDHEGVEGDRSWRIGVMVLCVVRCAFGCCLLLGALLLRHEKVRPNYLLVHGSGLLRRGVTERC